jgi:DHA1 family tetracycline resistance protein-like MFS transporter
MLTRYPQVFGLAIVVLIANMAHYVYPSVAVLFTEYRFGWDAKQVSWMLALVGLCSAIVQGLLVGRVIRALGERRALLLGLACGTLGFMIYGFAGTGWMFLAALPVSALWGLAAPSTQALITRQVSPDAQGRVQGALMSLVSLTGIFAPLMFAWTFGLFISDEAPVHLPGAPWLLAGVWLFVGLLVGVKFAKAPPAPQAAST